MRLEDLAPEIREEIAGRLVIPIELAGRITGVSRPTAYRAAAAGTIPTLRVSERRVVVPVARLLGLLGIDPRNEEGTPEGAPTPSPTTPPSPSPKENLSELSRHRT